MELLSDSGIYFHLSHSKYRYYIHVVINRNYNRVTKEEEFIVFNP